MYGIALYVLAHILVFFQINGQFLHSGFKRYEFGVASIGVLISYLYIYATQYTVRSMDGLLWPSRFIGFGIGMIVYAVNLNLFFDEGISMKTAVSLLLCIILICIQVLWK